MSAPAVRLFCLVSGMALGACAAAPSTIEPAPVGEAQFYGYTCRQLVEADARLNPVLAELYVEQSQSRTDDALGYLMLLTPAASMTRGDLRYLIAQRKGEREAIGRMLSRNCPNVRS